MLVLKSFELVSEQESNLWFSLSVRFYPSSLPSQTRPQPSVFLTSTEICTRTVVIIAMNSGLNYLQCRCMFSFTRAVRMSTAWTGSKTRKRRIFLSTVFANILRFFRTLIEFMFTFARSVWMPTAGISSKTRNWRILLSTVFTIKVCHIISSYKNTALAAAHGCAE